jgi:hypothetical protein
VLANDTRVDGDGDATNNVDVAVAVSRFAAHAALSLAIGSHAYRWTRARAPRAANRATPRDRFAGTPDARERADTKAHHNKDDTMAITNHTFGTIEARRLAHVTGGSTRVAASSRTDDLSTTMQTALTQIGSQIKDLANSKSNDQNSMLPMLMMMMMGGGGGGGGGAAAAPPPPQPTPTYVSVNVRGRGRC